MKHWIYFEQHIRLFNAHLDKQTFPQLCSNKSPDNNGEVAILGTKNIALAERKLSEGD